MLMRIFGPRRDAVTGEWRRTHNEDLCAHYSSVNIIRVIKSMGRSCSTYERVDKCIQGRRSLERPRHRWVGYIKIGL
jgi:hypothetical protein